MKYYARINDENVGPLSLKELVEVGIRPSTYIWSKGMPDWVRAEEDPDACRAFRRYLAGMDPETGEELALTSAEGDAANNIAEQQRQIREAAEKGWLGLHALPEPPDHTDFSMKPAGVSVITAILVTIFCFPFTGIVAIYFAMRCNASWKMSEADGIDEKQRKAYRVKAHSDARVYRMMLGITFSMGVIIFGMTLARLQL